MDSVSSTDSINLEIKTEQENILLNIIKDVCKENKLSSGLEEKVNKILAECDLTYNVNLHKMSPIDERSSTLLGFMNQISTELTFGEQTEFNEAIILYIQEKIPALILELDVLKNIALKVHNTNMDVTRKEDANITKKLAIIHEQENEKLRLMMKWVGHRLKEVSDFNNTSADLLTLKLKVLELKTTILNLQVYQGIYAETNQSIKAFLEAHGDLKNSIKDTDRRIEGHRQIIEIEYE